MEPRWMRAEPVAYRPQPDPRDTPIYNQLAREWVRRGRAMPGQRDAPPAPRPLPREVQPPRQLPRGATARWWPET